MTVHGGSILLYLNHTTVYSNYALLQTKYNLKNWGKSGQLFFLFFCLKMFTEQVQLVFRVEGRGRFYFRMFKL